ncbi:MAG: Endoglucanase H precursor [Bacteroidetes bacterium ADurb.Bin028]|nr:MAG: Endoglucanase H precursor [Bacteroidetes bacterium ADurb.Bin028]
MKKIVYVLFVLFIVVYFSNCEKNYDLCHSKSQWLKDYFAELKSGNYPNIYAISWWHEDFDNTYFKINSSKRSLKTYKELVSDDIFISSCSFVNKKLVPVSGKIYHSSFPCFSGTEDEVTSQRIEDFESLVEKEIAWAYFSNNWMDSLVFPKNSIDIILEKGKTPFIRLMFRSVFEQNQEDPKYKMKDILNGRYDAAIIAWANEAKNCSTNLLVEFGTEVNGVWFSWNGYYYGGGTCDEYGDPNYPDGPEIFRDSYRHIIDLCNQQGCDNITWFFHFDVNDAPEEWWNNPIYYYPGDDYIDWIGVSRYGPFQRGDDYIEPKEIINKAYKKMQNVSTLKPYAILEFGVTEL